MFRSRRQANLMIAVVRRLVAGAVALCLVVVIGSVGADAAVADSTGSVEGVVTAPDGTVPDGVTIVTAYSRGFNDLVVADPATGVFEFDGLDPGLWRIQVSYQGTHEYLPYLWGNGSWFYQSDAVNGTTVPAGAPTHLSLRLIAGATIGGHLTGANGSLANATIQLLSTTPGNPTGATGTFDVASQTWTATDVGPGSYSASFATTTGSYATEYWDQKGALLAATPLLVSEGVNAGGFNVTLQAGATIQGSVFDDRDGTLTAHPGGYLHAYLDSGSAPVEASLPLGPIDSLGHYSISGVYPGTWRVCAPPDSLSAVATCSSPVTVTAGGAGVASDLVLPVAGIISTQTFSSLPGGGTAPAQGQVLVYWWNVLTSTWVSEGDPFVGPGGYNTFDNLPPGDYKVEFFSGSVNVDSKWWNDERYEADADIIHLASGGDVALPVVVLPSRDFEVVRTWGDDRYEGAVEMSKEVYPDTYIPADGVPVVFVANGANYPDALSAGPAVMAQDGALLLVMTTSIPAVVADELRRLRPQRIEIAGGPGSVSDDVMQQLALFVDDPTDVTRLSGIDRYEASRNVAFDTFGIDGAPTVFLANGGNYPDALSAGPAAGLESAPVILVDGSKPSLDAATTDLLQELGAQTIFIAGGPASVSPGIEQSLRSQGLDVTRFSGETRYDVSVAISANFGWVGKVAFLATGEKFPDALTGGPLADLYQGPILLTPSNCIPASVAEEIQRRSNIERIWLLGGPASLTPNVEGLHACTN